MHLCISAERLQASSLLPLVPSRRAARSTHWVTSTLLELDTHSAWCPFTLRVPMAPVPLQQARRRAGRTGAGGEKLPRRR